MGIAAHEHLNSMYPELIDAKLAVLFVCARNRAGNRALSILSEAILHNLAAERFQAHSAAPNAQART